MFFSRLATYFCSFPRGSWVFDQFFYASEKRTRVAQLPVHIFQGASWGLPHLTCRDCPSVCLVVLELSFERWILFMPGRRRNRVIRIEGTDRTSNWLTWFCQSNVEVVLGSAWYSLSSPDTIHLCLRRCLCAFSWGSREGESEEQVKKCLCH